MDVYSIISYIMVCILAYLMGSIPSGFLLIRRFMAKDIRQYGSGNIGATNVKRIAGLKLGVATLSADVAKGALPVCLAWLVAGSEKQVFMALVALAAFLGHLFPCFLKFKGGKGVSTAAGGFVVIAPLGFVSALVVFLAGVVLTRRVSVGSLAASIALPLGVWWESHSIVFTVCSGIMTCLIVYKHSGNIARLMEGREPRF
jgi:acyl phosphate:glycerol-3-phosphate acyltransferase